MNQFQVGLIKYHLGSFFLVNDGFNRSDQNIIGAGFLPESVSEHLDFEPLDGEETPEREAAEAA